MYLDYLAKSLKTPRTIMHRITFFLACCLLTSSAVFTMEQPLTKKARLYQPVKQEEAAIETIIKQETPVASAVSSAHSARIAHQQSQLPALTVDAEYELIDAAETGKLDRVRQLLQKPGININANMGKGNALTRAVENNHADVVQLLLERPDININESTSSNGGNPLTIATMRGLTEIVKLLLKKPGIDIARELHGKKAFLLAAQYGHVEIVRALLSQFIIEVNQREQKGLTALMFAAKNGHNDVLELLLTQPGTLLEAEDSEGQTALQLAVRYGHADTVKKLLAWYPCVNTINHQCHAARPLNSTERKKKRKKEVVAQNRGETALMIAASLRRTTIVQLLLEVPSIDINKQTNTGDTALMLASTHGAKEVVRHLLKSHNIAINAQNSKGWTALMCAAKAGHEEIVHQLLEKGADMNAVSKDGWTALAVALQENHKGVVNEMFRTRPESINTLSRNKRTHAFLLACKQGYADIVQRFLCIPDINVNDQDREGCTALIYAVAGSDSDSCKEIVRLLLAIPNINVNVENGRGETALVIAAAYKKIEIVRMLIDAGANTEYALNFARNNQYPAFATASPDITLRFQDIINAIRSVQVAIPAAQQTVQIAAPRQVAEQPIAQLPHPVSEENILESVTRFFLERPELFENFDPNSIVTPLLFAAQYGNIELAQRILEKAPNCINIPNHLGDTPLHIAITTGQSHIALYLIQAGANIQLQNKLGQTPLMLAAKHRDIQVYRHLVSKNANQSAVDTQGKTYQDYVTEAMQRTMQETSALQRMMQ